MRSMVEHPLAPIYNADTRVLILGTMPSPESRRRGFYYAHPNNRFWPVLAAVLGEAMPQDDAGKREMALRHGVGLWDVLRSCTIDGAADSSIKNPVPNDIAALIEASKVKAVFATGQQAYRLYTKLCLVNTGVEAVALPSPSPANCACKYETLIAAYSRILDWL